MTALHCPLIINSLEAVPCAWPWVSGSSPTTSPGLEPSAYSRPMPLRSNSRHGRFGCPSVTGCGKKGPAR
jgi:hypothetical protein